MLGVLQTVLPVFIVLGAGYAAVRFGLFGRDHTDALMRYVQGFAVPILLFKALAHLDLATVFKAELLISYYTGSLTCFVLGILGARFLFGRRPGEAIVVGFAALFSNTVLLGLPIMEHAYGVASTTANFAIIAVHAPFCYLLGITTMEFFRADGRPLHQTARIIVRSIFSNAITIGLLLGFAVNLSGIVLPDSVEVAVDIMARSALPAALFSLGGILVRYSLTDRLAEITMVCALRLIVHPSIAYVLSSMVFGLSDNFVRAAVISSAMAPGVNAYVFANIYDRAKGTVASAVLIGTVASIFSITVWLLILGT